MNDILFWVGTGFVISMIPALTGFLIRYLTRSPWRSTMPGRAVAYLAASLDLALIVGLIYVLFPDLPGWLWVRAIVYGLIAATVWGLLVVLIKMQRHPEEHADEWTPPEGIPRLNPEEV